MDKLQAMAAFVQIVDRGSLSSASEALNTSLSSMVRTLAALERSLGVRLLNRTTRRLALTEEGRHYLERCRRILSEVEEAEHALNARQHKPTGLLKITAPVLFGQLHVAPAISRFLARHPGMHVDLMLVDRVVNLVEEGIDIAVRIGRLSDSSVVAVPVGEVRRIVVAAPGLVRTTGMPTHPRHLQELPCVRLTGLAPRTNWTFVERGRTMSVKVNGPLACNQAAASVDACLNSLGFGMFLSYQVRDHLQAKRLMEVLTDFAPAPLPVNLVFPHARLLSSRVRAFLDFATGELRRVLRTNGRVLPSPSASPPSTASRQRPPI